MPFIYRDGAQLFCKPSSAPRPSRRTPVSRWCKGWYLIARRVYWWWLRGVTL